MFLSDIDIKKCIKDEIITIISDKKIGIVYRQCGIRVHLDHIIFEFKEPKKKCIIGGITPLLVDIDKIDSGRTADINIKKKFFTEKNIQADYEEKNGYILKPGKMILGSTVEKIKLPNYMVAFLDGRSTLARFGVTCNITASIVDARKTDEPKNISLTIKNFGPFDIVLSPKCGIGMLSFINISGRSSIEQSDQYTGSSSNSPIPKSNFEEKPKQRSSL